MEKHNIKAKTNYKQAMEENTIMQKSKQTNRQRKREVPRT
jgi:hypothetical protein